MRTLKYLGAAAAVLLLAALALGWLLLRASLPRLDGALAASGLTGAVRITRDSRGVHAGVADLAGRPWEYWVLGAPPLPWRPEDTILIEHAMWWDLQANGLRREILRQEINARLGGALCGARWKCGLSFLYPAGTSWDAPVAPAQGVVSAAEPAVPPAEVLDVRTGSAAAAVSGSVPRAPAAGSNSWAVAGRLTATGAALVANDMHLG